MKKSSVLVLTALSSVFLLCACGSSKTDVTDYVTVDFSGLQKEGTASYDLDEEKLVKDLFNIDKDVLEDSTIDAVTLTEIKDTEEAIDIKLDKKKGLKNGDTVTVTVDVDENLTDKVKDSKKKFKVEGLMEPKILTSKDVEDMVEYTFEGLNEVSATIFDAELTFEDTEKNLRLSTVKDPSELKKNLKNGDVVEFYFDDSDIDRLKKNGYILEDENVILKTTVKGLKELKVLTLKDLEDMVEYNFEGLSGVYTPNIDATLTFKDTAEKLTLSTVKDLYEIKEKLKNGDVVEFCFEDSDIAVFKRNGYVLEDENVILKATVKGLNKLTKYK